MALPWKKSCGAPDCLCWCVAWQVVKHNITNGIRAALLMPFKSRSQENLYATAASSTPPTAASPQGTCPDDHAVAITMTLLLLLRPDMVHTHTVKSPSYGGPSLWRTKR